MERNLQNNKLNFLNSSNSGNTKEILDEKCDFKDNPLIESLVNMFPLIPETLFYPLLNLEEMELGDLVIKLTSQENNVDVVDILMQFENKADKADDSDSDNGSYSSKRSAEDEVTSMDDDQMFAKIEEEETGLVLGRTFLKEAHRLFSSKCGLDYLTIDNMPPEITEMDWKVPSDLMFQIYCAFFENLGVIESTSEQNEIKKPKQEDRMTMREIQELEEALSKSIETQRAKIRDSFQLTMQIDSLRMKFPQISLDELERVFISCDMNTCRTVHQLSQAGFANNDDRSARRPPPRRDKTIKSSENIVNAVRVQRLQQRIDAETERMAHVQSRLNTGSGQAQTYWREELSQSRQRQRWFRDQMAIATVAQQSIIYGNRHLDLHGLTRTSALAAVEQRLTELSRSQPQPGLSNHLHIICGRGLHSLHGRPRLKPAVQQYLHRENIKYSQPFDGTFRVSLAQLRRR